MAFWERRRPKEEPKQKDRDFFTTYSTFCYRLLGKRMERPQQRSRTLDRIRKANLPLTPATYSSMQIVTGMVAAISSLAASVLIFLLLLNLDAWYLFVAGMVALTTVAALMVLPMAISVRISNRKSKLDRELPFTLSELSILASTGLSPIEVLRRMAQRDVNPSMAGEFKRIMFKIDVEGKDLITALGEAAKETPSDLLRESLWDISNMIHQGGDLDIYLRAKADEIMNLKRAIQKEFIDKLTTMSDVYVSLVLIGVLFIAIAAFLMDALGSTFGGIDAETLLLLLTYFIIPISVFAVAMVVSSAYSKAE